MSTACHPSDHCFCYRCYWHPLRLVELWVQLAQTSSHLDVLYKRNRLRRFIEQSVRVSYLICGFASNVILGFVCTGGGGGGGLVNIDVCGGLAMILGGALNTFGACWRTSLDAFDGGGTLGGNGGRTFGGIRTSKTRSLVGKFALNEIVTWISSKKCSWRWWWR